MALQGTLDTFSLPDVLRLLATTSKTGRLRLEGDRGRGSVWLAEGSVVDATAERAMDGTPVDEVVFELLRFASGSFAFDGDDVATGSKTPEDVDGLLRRANSLLSEWNELENVVPSLEHEVRLANDLSADEVTIDADRWKSLVAVASGRTVGELATVLSLTELGVSRAVRDLVDLGVAEVDAPGTAPEPVRRPAPAARDITRRPPDPRTDPTGVAAVGRSPLTGETPRAGWYQTGETPVVGNDRRVSPGGNGHGRASLDDTMATPPPAPKMDEPPSKGGLTSRLGRNRNASTGSRGNDGPPTGPTPPVTGANPSVSNGSARPPLSPPARTNDTGRTLNGNADDGPATRRDRPTSRSRGPEGPSRSGSPAGPGPDLTVPFDGGRLGPSVSPRDTGQIRPVTPSSLPPDLHWAADDTGGGSTNGGPASSPFSGLSSLGPSRPAPGPAAGPGPSRPPARDGEIAPHVAAMSAEARAAVQSTVGNAGGSTGARSGSQGEDIAQRGRLISFLSTVR